MDQTESLQGMENKFIIVFSDDNASLLKDLSAEERGTFARKKAYGLFEELAIPTNRIEYIFNQGFLGFSAYLSEMELTRIKKTGAVKRVEPDMEISLPSLPESKQKKVPFGLKQKVSGDLIPDGVRRVGGPVKYKGKHVVYIVDSGIDLKNKELNVDESRGFNAVFSGKDSRSLQDHHGHGTHIAGIVGAKMDGVGIAGVAAGATVVPIKIVDKDGNGTYIGFLAAIEHIVNHGCPGDVVNISITTSPTPTLEEAILRGANKGINFVLAAGNDRDDANNYTPGRLNGENIYTVSAMDGEDNFAGFSNYGTPPIDWCAPGVGVLSTGIEGRYNFRNGTSMAAPHVASLVLLGGPEKDGKVKNDPDGICDPIAVYNCD